MSLLSETKFRFTSRAYPSNQNGDVFAVVEFTGSEGLFMLYEFNITLVTKEDIDLAQLLQHMATFTLVREDGDIPFHGIVQHATRLHSFNQHVFYQVRIAPRLWWLTRTCHNQVFLDKTTPDILKAVLQDGGLTSNDFTLNATQDYDPWEFICQYNETHYHFLARWLEREGLYYYFDQTTTDDVLKITDINTLHKPLGQGGDLKFHPPSGLEQPSGEEVVRSFSCRQRVVPQAVRVHDYNYRTPSLDVSASAQSAQFGRGQINVYGEHARTPSEAKRLATVFSQMLTCQERRFYGTGSTPLLRPGFLFSLTNHFIEAFNEQEFLAIRLKHRGSQAAYLTHGLSENLSEHEQHPYYSNEFTAIPANVQFRPEHRLEKPRFHGVINALVDGPESEQYAHVDDQGRYKVVLPFDLSGRKDGGASAWLRMMQPYGGEKHGMHMPLHKGTEVLLTFADGDPDRPIIAAAAPNPEKPSPVTAANKTFLGLQTAGGSSLYMQDKENHQHIGIQTGDNNSALRLGYGSPDHVSAASSSVNYVGTAAGAMLNMIGMRRIAMLSDVSLTGLWCIALSTGLWEWVMKKCPDLINTTKTKSEDKLLVMEGIFELVGEALWAGLTYLAEEKIISNTHHDLGMSHHVAYAAISRRSGRIKGSTYVLNTGKGKDIFLGTDQGALMSLSDGDTYALASTDLELSARNEALLSSQYGEVRVKGSQVDFKTEESSIAMCDDSDDFAFKATGSFGKIQAKSKRAITLKCPEDGGGQGMMTKEGVSLQAGTGNNIGLHVGGAGVAKPDSFLHVAPDMIGVKGTSLKFQCGGGAVYNFTEQGELKLSKLYSEGGRTRVVKFVGGSLEFVFI